MPSMPSWVPTGDEGALDAHLVQLIDGPSGLLVGLAALAIAAVVGAVHALGPGHGKALIGAYLASSRGRPRDAVALGGVVAAMHTGSVLVLGLGFTLTQQTVGGTRLTPVLTLVSAAAIVAVGAYMLTTQVRSFRTRTRLVRVGDGGPADPSPEGDGEHHNGHDGGHSHHLPPGTPPLSRSGVVALASSGGLLPSPAAFLVLATSLAIGRAGFGLALVAAFSLGLAATLTAIGLAVLRGRDAMARRAARAGRSRGLAPLLPMLGAAAIVVGGLVIAGRALTQL